MENMFWSKIKLIIYTLVIMVMTAIIVEFCRDIREPLSDDNKQYQVGFSDGYMSGAKFITDGLNDNSTKIIIIKQ